jgi:hypothetical protein
MTELLAEFSSSAYLTDTPLSRLKRIPQFLCVISAPARATEKSELIFPLPIGFFVRDERRFNAWCASSDMDNKIFLKYRLDARFAPGRFAATKLPCYPGCWPQYGDP